MIALGLMLALVTSASPSAPAELPIYLMEVPPLTINAPERKGLVGDIVIEAIKRAGYQPRIIVVPNNRALTVVASPDMHDTLIIPLARLEEREPKYTWIAPIVKVNRGFFSTKRQVHSFDEARVSFTLIGVARGTAGISILHREGFDDKQIYELNQGEGALKMLMMGRIDAWYGPIAEGRAMLKAINAPDKVAISSPLGPTFNYLGCSKICDPAIVARLAGALKEMEADGTSKAIRLKYGDLEQ
ncbi:MAG: transporter substrate-binding domain-containing protein [Pseudomonadota bacterium]